MITQIRVDGFKSFVGFQLDVPPSLIMLGANGAGKSNLFDALRLAAGTVLHGFEETVAEDVRLSPKGLFHRGGDDGRVQRDAFTIEVGMVVPAAEGPLPLRLRLTVAREQREAGPASAPGLVRGKSAVWVSSLQAADWVRDIGLDDGVLSAMREARERFLARTGTEIAPVGQGYFPGAGSEGASQDDLFDLFPESRGAAELLSLVANECRGWEPLQLRPEIMRQLSPAGLDAPLGVHGDHLALALARLERAPEHIWRRYVADCAGLVEGLRDVRPYLIERRDEYDFEVEFEHTGWLVPSLLSDGTLRMLGLLAASMDPLRPGTLCVEELENGMHPSYVADLVRRLRRRVGVSTGPQRKRAPYRQLIATTHSPALLAALRTDLSGSLVFLEQAHRTNPEDRTVSRVTRALPLRAGDDVPEASISPDQVARLLRRLGQEAA
ncbi:AAA family ATPase [Streptomyces albus subsp. chlorinus]|uniref:AAA family ATPase n=1 Tax=Streptomyces albus TaxID=1888 RepID=UPI001570F356|nr:AAA family ATPase [Streptomyces albus]NSC24062.1 AAA family ATPase [Streptomyces albus subsp. chlorinus]